MTTSCGTPERPAPSADFADGRFNILHGAAGGFGETIMTIVAFEKKMVPIMERRIAFVLPDVSRFADRAWSISMTAKDGWVYTTA